MRKNVQTIETLNAYHKEEIYYASDNQLEMLKFLVNAAILKERYKDVIKLDSKAKKKLRKRKRP